MTVGIKLFLHHLQFYRQLLDKIEQLQRSLSDMTIRTQELESALALTRISSDLCRTTSGAIRPPETPQLSDMLAESSAPPCSTLKDADCEIFLAHMQLKSVGTNPTPVPEHILRSLVACLPSRPQAVWLCELYLDFPGYFRAFNRQEMVEEVFTKLYDNEDRINHLQPRPHLLAVIFFIFAIAATFDRSVPSDNDAAKTYFRLGNQCLDLRCLGSSNGLESVQAIALLSQFQSMTPEREQSDGAWFYGSMAVKLATKVRLHQQMHPPD